ncbi:MAG: nucleoside triphosphate pyrophosphohydrolase [Syntrophomonadaceae bacterium]|nr:nucleoside triphosphate pyrophosphohydrolase [Syntrophomonadaceae bacterium]
MASDAGGNLNELVQIMEKLLSPEGCPWDKEQTHNSLTRFLIEESYEVLDAIEQEDTEQLKEELGDVLFQVVFHSALAEKEGWFTLADVIKNNKEKMVRRHPHVFASLALNTSQEVLNHWEGFKKEEGKKQLLTGIPRMLPALMRALKIQEKVSQAGFDFSGLPEAIKKMQEEIREFAEAGKPEERFAELGDMLFSLVNIARFMNIDPEAALQFCNDKFTERFNYIEAQCADEGLEISGAAKEELDNFWRQAKLFNFFKKKDY